MQELVLRAGGEAGEGRAGRAGGANEEGVGQEEGARSEKLGKQSGCFQRTESETFFYERVLVTRSRTKNISGNGGKQESTRVGNDEIGCEE